MSIRMSGARVVLALGLVAGLGGRPAAADTYTVDAVHSTVIFRIKHVNTSYSYGRFNAISGHFALDDQDGTHSQLDFQVKVDSLDTANANRDQHLKGPEFFNAVQYPTISFKSKSVSKTGPDVYQVSGDLTLRGVTRPLTVKLTKTGTGKDMKGHAIAGFETVFAIKRSDFKMATMVGPIGDDVWVTVAVEGAQ